MPVPKKCDSRSGMRKYPETEMAAPSLRGHVRYNCAAFAGMDGCHIYEIFIGGCRYDKSF